MWGGCDAGGYYECALAAAGCHRSPKRGCCEVSSPLHPNAHQCGKCIHFSMDMILWSLVVPGSQSVKGDKTDYSVTDT
jgi:hypothetical protein